MKRKDFVLKAAVTTLFGSVAFETVLNSVLNRIDEWRVAEGLADGTARRLRGAAWAETPSYTCYVSDSSDVLAAEGTMALT